MLRWSALGAVACLALAATLPARADEVAPLHARLEWSAPRECVSRAALERRVAARLGRAVFAAGGAPDARVRGHVRSAGRGWVAVLQLRRRDGAYVGSRELRLEGRDCTALDDPLALVLALLIDLPRDDVRLRVPEPAPDGRSWVVGAETSAVASLGPLPVLAPGLRVAISVEPPWLPRLEIAGGLLAAVRSGTGAEGLEMGARYLGIAACAPSGRSGGLWLRGCAGVDLYSLRGRGYGFDRNHERDRGFVVGVARGAFGLKLTGPLSAVATLDFGVPFRRPSFFVTTAAGGQRELHRPAAVLGALSLGLSLTLPNAPSW